MGRLLRVAIGINWAMCSVSWRPVSGSTESNLQDYAVFMLDAAGCVATWNVGAQRLAGYSTPEIIGRPFSVFYPAADVPAGKPQRELEVASADGHLEDEGWRVRRDGSQLWANVVITAVRDRDGTLLGFGKITRDLTERRVAQERLGGAEEQFRRSFDDAPIAMMIVGLDGRYLQVDDAFCAILGHSRASLIGRRSPMSALGCSFALDDFGAGVGSL